LIDTSNHGLVIERKNYKEIEIDGRTAYECDIRHITVEELVKEWQEMQEATRLEALEQAMLDMMGGLFS
jgi:hypothetical protein